MFECKYCDLTFQDKKLLVLHHKTKKCLTHRHVGFVCQKCFQLIKGYENTLNHVSECKTQLSEEGMLISLVNQLSLKYETTITFENKNSGTINFKLMNLYKHPLKLTYGIMVPQRPHLFFKTLYKYTDDQIMESCTLYLNDMYNKILRLSDTFQFLSVKYNTSELLNILWINTPYSGIYLKDEELYILGRIQCQNNEGQKWFGDTFILKEGEKIVKCLWTKDPQLKLFFNYLKILLKDVLNLYLVLGNWSLKQKKIKFKAKDDHLYKNNIIQNVMEEFKLTTLIKNIQNLNCYETFYSTIQNLIKKKWSIEPPILHTNIQQVFKDNQTIPLNENQYMSLMDMKDPELIGENYNSLLYYVLPEYDKKIFASKE